MKNQNRKSKPASMLAVIVCIVLLAVFRLLGGSDGDTGTESTSVAAVQEAETADITENLVGADPLQQENAAASQLQQADQSADSQDSNQADADIRTQAKSQATSDAESLTENNGKAAQEYHFRSNKLLNSHYEKHGIEMGFDSAEEYEAAASDVVNNPDALHKTESEDGDDIYYLEDSNEFVVVSIDGYIRTYFNPDSGIKYYNKQ